MPTRASVLILSFIGRPCVTAECTAAFGNCLDTTCCVNGNFGCYKHNNSVS